MKNTLLEGAMKVPTLEGAALHKIHFGKRRSDFPFENSLFYASKLEDNRKKIHFPLPPHRKTVYDFILITKGESIRSKGLNEYHFGKNQLFFLPAFQITTHKSMSEDVEGYFVHFSSDLFSDFSGVLNSFSFLKFNTQPIVNLPEKELVPILNIFERLITLYHNPQLKNSKKIIRTYLLSLFYEITQFLKVTDEETKDTATKITQKYKDELSQNIYNYRTVAEFSDRLHITPNHLNKCVKKTLNKTAQDLLNEMLLLEAKALLKYSDYTVFEISYNLLKSSPSNFSRFFKFHTGMTPIEFRNS